MEAKEEVKVNKDVSNIKSTELGDLAKESEQFVKKEDPKGVNIVKEQVIEPARKEVEQVKTVDDMKDKLIGVETLATKHQISVVLEQRLEGRIFGINVPDCKFKKYMRFRDQGGHIDVEGMTDLSPLYMRSLEQLNIGINLNCNSFPSITTRYFTKPGVTNLVLVYEHDSNNAVSIPLTNFFNLVPNVPGYDLNDDTKKVLCAEWAVFDNIDPHQTPFNPGNMLEVHGGPSSHDGQGFVYKIRLEYLDNTELSYEGPMTAYYNKLNYDPLIPNQLLDPMRRVNLRPANPQMRDVISYLYNQAPKDSLCYSPLVEQLKLALYTDMVNTGFDMVEGLSQMGCRSRTRFVYNSAQNYYMHENRDTVNIDPHPSAKDIFIAGCTWAQYLNFANGAVPGNNNNYDMRRDWVCVPIKRDWLLDSEALIMYILSLIPYPIGSYYIPLSWPLDVEMSDVSNNVRYRRWDGYAEHCSGRVRIDGINNILFVLVDSNANDPADPNLAAYDQFWSIQYAGVNTVILNLFNLPNNPGRQVEFHNTIYRWLVNASIYAQDRPMVILDGWLRLIHWSIYSDIFNMVAYLTTRNGMMYSSTEDIGVRLNTESLCSLIPAVLQQEQGYHMVLKTPTFFQRCYAILGMVRQKGSDFLGSLSKLDIREFMMGKRYAVACVKSYLLEVKRNQVRVLFPGHQTNPIDGQLENRRRNFALLYNEYIEVTSEIKAGNKLYNSTGFISYIRSGVQADTWMESWGVGWSDMNEYSGLEDWAGLMNTTLKRNFGGLAVVDEKLVPDWLISNEGNLIEFGPKVHTGAAMDEFLQLMNHMFGRTLHRYSGRQGDITMQMWYVSYNDRMNQAARILFQPFWLYGLYAWNADKDNAIIRMPKILLPSFPITLGNDDKYIFPFIRCLDYNLPALHFWDKKFFVYQLSYGLFEIPVPYINVTLDNKEIITLKDYINRQGYDDFNK